MTRTEIVKCVGLDVFVVLAAEELCCPEIASRTGVPLQEVKHRMRRAYRSGAVTRRTNPSKPIEFLYKLEVTA